MSALAFATAYAPVTLASSGDGDNSILGIILFLVPFAVGWFTYTTLYRRYRNQDQRYQFEVTTSAVRSNLKRWDTFSRKNNRQRNRTIAGRNDDEPLTRAGHSVVREAQELREAQEERQAQAAREAQPAREAQEERQAQPGQSSDPHHDPGQQ